MIVKNDLHFPQRPHMNKTIFLFSSILLLLCLLILPQNILARPSTSVKFATIRAENPNEEKETLILPFAFPSESMGTTIGVGSLAKGYGQKQLLVAGAAWASADEAIGGVAGVWDYRLPFTSRFFVSGLGSAGQ